MLTSRKENPLVETVLVSPQPASEDNNTILAGWTYGLGKAVAFTTDAGERWTTSGRTRPTTTSSSARSSAGRCGPAGGSGKFTVATEVADGKVRVVVTALDKNDEFLNFLGMTGTAVGPDLKPLPTGDGADRAGPLRGHVSPSATPAATFMMISPGAGMAPIRTGVNVPYSDEFRDRATNDALLAQLAALTPKGGAPARLIEAAADGPPPLEQMLRSTPSATICPRPPAARTSGTSWCWRPAACSWPTYSSAACR